MEFITYKKGHIPTEETRRKISIAQKNLSPEKRANITHGMRYHRYTAEYAKKLSDTKLGTINPQAKLTEEDVRYIKKLWATRNYSVQAISEKIATPISRQSVSDIVHNRTWKHIK